MAPSIAWSRRYRRRQRLGVSGVGVLTRRLVPGLRPPKVPGVTATLMRSLILGAASERDRHVEAGLADLYLSLDLRGVGMLEFDAVSEVAARGYEAAVEPETQWAEKVGGNWL